MKPLLRSALVALLYVASSHLAQAAPATTTAASTTLSPSEQKFLNDARALMRVTSLWNKPLDWKESESSLATIIGHIKTALGAEAPPIEVRGPDDNRSSFVLEASPLGPTLSSVAELAGCQVWVFPERILLAPQKALTEDERQAVLNRAAGEWKQSSEAMGRNGWSSRDVWNKTVFAIVGSEIKSRLAAKGIAVPAPPYLKRFVEGKPLPPAYELPLGELSPTAQQLLQELVNRASPRELLRPASQQNPAPPPALTETDLVNFDDTSSQYQNLKLIRPQPQRGELGDWNLEIREPLLRLPR